MLFVCGFNLCTLIVDLFLLCVGLIGWFVPESVWFACGCGGYCYALLGVWIVYYLVGFTVVGAWTADFC